MTLVIPPLRERRGLIGPLALRFLQEARRDPSARLAAEVIAALEAYPWPGNVRELKAVIERAVLLARAGDITVRHLAFAKSTTAPPPPGTPAPAAAAAPPTGHHAVPTPPAMQAVAPAAEPALDFLDETQRAERTQLLAALDECAGNQTRAARKLGMSRTTLVTKLRLYRIPRPRA